MNGVKICPECKHEMSKVAYFCNILGKPSKEWWSCTSCQYFEY